MDTRNTEDNTVDNTKNTDETTITYNINMANIENKTVTENTDHGNTTNTEMFQDEVRLHLYKVQS